MSLLLFQEIDTFNEEQSNKIERETIGELKTIRFMREFNKDDLRRMTKEEEILLIAWCNGERTNEVLKNDEKDLKKLMKEYSERYISQYDSHMYFEEDVLLMLKEVKGGNK